MSRSLDETLRSVAEKTIEDLAFMFAIPEEDPQPAIVDERSAVVEFEGPMSGTFKLTVSSDMLPVLAANMLGLEDASASTPDQQDDALKELANVLCGNLLPAIAGTEPVFDVHAPVILAEGAAETVPQRKVPVATARLTLDAGTGRVELFWKSRLKQALRKSAQMTETRSD